jgi:glycine hydroxymethyltransferase
LVFQQKPHAQEIAMSTATSLLSAFDSDIAEAIRAEEKRQRETLDLIASENYTYPEVLITNASVLTDKYAEGYPGRRYYAGQKYYDRIETIAIDRAKAIFRAEHANVQPLSGSPMNQAVYFGLLQPGDTILAMDLSHGGHLTHGSPLSHMGKIFRFVRYKTTGVRGDIDFEVLRAQALECRPKMILCGHSSYPRELDYRAFKRLADEVGAIAMADVSHVGGLIAANVLRNPLDDGFDVMTTTTHKTLRGPRGGLILCRAHYGKTIDKSVFPGLQGGPHMQAIAGIAVALKKAATPAFHVNGCQIVANANALARALTGAGARLITGGTENHLLVMDVVKSYGMNGAEAQERLEQLGIVSNKQVIPDDALPPLRSSGIRLGTPAATTRGMKEGQMTQIAMWIDAALRGRATPDHSRRIAAEVAALCAHFPPPTLSTQDATL